ncbi:MAG: hypothetical protein E7172_05245 [Firmicutes bacterium]|nr:hypothetical protein [Bacillota bacterium]
MEEVQTISFDDKEYMITDEIIIDNIKYTYLTNIHNLKEFIIKKIKIINNEETITNLNNEEEFLKALDVFKEKHKHQFQS